MKSINLSDIANSNIDCIISSISKNKTTNLLQNFDLNEKSGTLQKKWKSYKLKNIFLEAYINMKNKITNCGNIEIQKQKFHQHKRPISIKA